MCIFASNINLDWSNMYDIKKAIKQKGFTLKQVSDKLSVTQSALSQQINNNTISVAKVQQIADILGCPLTDLLADDEDNNHIMLICPHCGRPIKLTISHD